MYQVMTLNAISDVIYEQLNREEFYVGADLDDPDAILVRSADLRERPINGRLLAIARAGAGVNNISIDRCTQHGVVVFNTPGANANAVKELALCCMLMTTRNVMRGIHWTNTLRGDDIMMQVEQGKRQFSGHELSGKSLAVIGLGAIGAMVANDARAIGMHVSGYDPFISVEHAWSLSRGIRRAESLEELLPQSDFVTIHVPLMAKTRHFMNKALFDLMKPGAILLNLARGELVDHAALLEAVESGNIGGYITDFPEACLLNKERIVCVPHLGASTPESEENCARMASMELYEYLTLGNINNSVNMPTCSMVPAGVYRICAMHENKRNMVGQITSAIADFNISHMMNKSRGDLAYTLIDLDHMPDESALEAIRAICGMKRLRHMRLPENSHMKLNGHN